MSNVLDKMAKVMQDASTPFARLNEKNEFVKVNRSTLIVLEHLCLTQRPSPREAIK